MERFSAKLGCALHYRETGVIVPSDAAIVTRWYSNLQVQEGEFPADLVRHAPKAPPLVRSTRVLNDQFSYRVGLSDDKTIGLYVCFFRQSFVTATFIVFDKQLVDPDLRVTHPFRHSSVSEA